MEPALLGLIAPTVSATGNLLNRTAQAATRPFAALLRASANALDRDAGSAREAGDAGTKSLAKALGSNKGSSQEQNLSLREMRESADAMKSSLEQRIHEALAQAGVTFDDSLRIGISEVDGEIELVSDHQQRALIETILSRDFELAAEVHELVALQRLLSFADENEDFRAALEENPLQAIAEYRAQLDQAAIELDVSPPSGSDYQMFG